MPFDREKLRYRTAVGGGLVALAVFFVLLAGVVDEGPTPTLVGGLVLALAGVLALASVHTDRSVILVGRRFGPHRRVGVGYVLLAVAVAVPLVPRLSLDVISLSYLASLGAILALGYQELTGPHEPAEPSVRRVATIVVLGVVVAVGLPLVLIALG